MDRSKIFTVSEINGSIRGILESQFPFISVAGEISNLRQPFSGHMYFTLKDDQAQIKAVLFKMQQRYLPEEMADGRRAVCRGRISVYEPRGDYQLIVDAVDFHGTGALQLEFERLKKRLADEGLFDEAKKKSLPAMPEHITLITSPHGAAVHDFLKVAGGRCPQVKISVYPVAVQGDHAATEIADGLAIINASLQTSMIVLCRGGGSLEDLQPFNEEKVARAIADSLIPVVNAVGHEIDFTIADFTADMRAPTPSAAAEMILPDSLMLHKQVNQMGNRIVRVMDTLLDRYEEKIILHKHKLGTLKQWFDNLLIRLDHLSVDLEKSAKNILLQKQAQLAHTRHLLQANNPLNQLKLQAQHLNELHRRLLMTVDRKMNDCDDALSHTAGMLDAVSPLSTLARGYSITRKNSADGAIVTDHRQVQVDNKINITLHRGHLECRIEKTGESRFLEIIKKEKTRGESVD
jgi:exodeoxyribonuclease VII large subunit